MQKRKEKLVAGLILASCLCIAVAILASTFVGRASRHPDSPHFWVKRIDDSDTETRLAALGVLSAIQPKSDRTVDALLGATFDANPRIRYRAVVALRGETRATARIKEAAQGDPDPLVREVASAVVRGDFDN